MVSSTFSKAFLCLGFILLTSCLSTDVLTKDFYIPSLSLSRIPPGANQPFPEYVTSLGYPCEVHSITTLDGYINTYFRIQAKGSTIQSGLPVVYLQHGLVDSSDTWIVNSEDQAPGLIVANAGFDVWVGNTRGNTYSQGHITEKASDSSSPYWDFSYQEMSQYDLPAAFEYIFNQTGQNINYIGHSQGTTIMFAALARQDPTVLKYLKHFIALAPVVYVDHLISPLADVLSAVNLGLILEIIEVKKFLFIPPAMKHVLELLCEYVDEACILQLRLISDTKPSVDNTKRMDVILGHFPGGTSVQNMEYWTQMMHSNVFKMYDYGKKKNNEVYGQPTPPVYDLSKINVPVYMFAGIYDELAYLNSTETVRDQLTGSPYVYYKTYPLGHASFIWGKNVTGYFGDVLDIIKP